MSADHATLSALISALHENAAVAAKVAISEAYAPVRSLAGSVRVGDDCAAIPDGDGFLLLAAEGMLESFVADDPWFAGYSAVMVNLSDVAAMGGSPLAIVDVLWTPGIEQSSSIWDGMAAASRAYGVPIVGGHTTVAKTGSAFLAAAVLGRADKLITSFDAKPGDDLVAAIDLRGEYRRGKPFWNASVSAPASRLQADLALFPTLARLDLCAAGKDISNGGIVGTLAMLLECSGVGAELQIERIPRPAGSELARWLVSFPSFGYLLSVAPKHTPAVLNLFSAREIACAVVGRITREPTLVLTCGAAQAVFLEGMPGAPAESLRRAMSP